MPLTTTQSAPAIADQTMTAVSSDQPTFQATAAAPVITLSAPASPLHVERAQLVAGSPTKSADYSQPDWEIPTPNTSDINPRGDFPSIRAGLLREGSDAEKLPRLRLHREQLEALDPVLFDWDSRVKAHVPLLEAALRAEEATGITLLHRIQQLSMAQSKLPSNLSDTDARWVSHQTSADAAQTDLRMCEGRQAFLKARILETKSLLWYTSEQLDAANKEWSLLGEDIKQVARRVAATRTANTRPREDSPPSSIKRAKTEEDIVDLPEQGAHWPALALPRGESRGRKFRDPAFNAPKYQQALGLHQVFTSDQTRLARNKIYLNTATKALCSRFSPNDPIVHEQEVNLVFTNMDAEDYQDQEIVTALGALGLRFAGTPKWLTSNPGQAQDTRTITARVPAMTELLWEYIEQTAISADGIPMTIKMGKTDVTMDYQLVFYAELTNYARKNLGAEAFPLTAQGLLNARGVRVKIQPRKRDSWYKSILRTGVFELCFRSNRDVETFENIPVSERPFVITHSDESQGTRNLNTTIHIADSGHTSQEMGRYKLDMLFVSPNLDTSIVKDMMDDSGLRFNGMLHEQLNGTSKVQLGFDEEDDMHDAIASLHDAWRPDIKARGGLCVSIKYDVPRGHCFKCYNPGYTKTSKGHTARDCQEDTCFICHRNHDTEKCGLIAQKKVIQHRHHTISEREREIIAKARLQRLMHGGGNAPVDDVGSVLGGPAVGPYYGSQYPSDYAGSVIGPPPGEGRYPSDYNGSIVSAPRSRYSTDQTSPPSRRDFVQQPITDSEGLYQPSSPLWQGSQQRNMDTLPPGYPAYNPRGSTPAAHDRNKPPDFSHRQPAGDDDGRARMSPPEHRGGNQRPSPPDRRAYQAPQEEFYRTPRKKDVSRRPRRRSSPFATLCRLITSQTLAGPRQHLARQRV